jgi:hypothetical protein
VGVLELVTHRDRCGVQLIVLMMLDLCSCRAVCLTFSWLFDFLHLTCAGLCWLVLSCGELLLMIYTLVCLSACRSGICSVDPRARASSTCVLAAAGVCLLFPDRIPPRDPVISMHEQHS